MSDYLPLPIYNSDDESQGFDDELEQDEDALEIAATGEQIRLAVTVDDIRLEEKLESFPKNPGVYQYKNAAGKVIYVGKAKNLKNRVRSYFLNYRRGEGDGKFKALVEKIADVELLLTDSDVEALILENTLIKKLKPRYNVMLRDDKTYPWVCITNEPYPRVFPTRRRKHDGSKYFGPYTDVMTLRYVLQTLRDIFSLRTCNLPIDDDFIARKKARVCLEYHIKRCDGPCEGLVSQKDYAEMIRKVRQFLAGRTRELSKELQTEMHRQAEVMHFEDAAKIRDQIKVLAEYSNKQKVVSEERVDRDIFAFASEDDDAAGIVFKVRDGNLSGKQQFFFTGAEGKSEQEVLEALLERYYSTTDYIPEEIFLPFDLENSDTFEAWLGRRSRELSNDEDAGAMKPPKMIVPKIGDKAKLIAMASTNAKFVLGEIKIQKLKQSDFVPHAVKALQRDLHLEKLPRHIECFDNSHLQGTEYVSSMVYFENGKPKKDQYRKYKLRTVEGNDDFAAMREVVMRRYGRLLDENSELPDLIIIDGGKGQLSSAYEVLKELNLTAIPTIGLAKRLEEVFTIGSSDSILLPRSSSSLKLLQNIRDEAHNFAISYHRNLRGKRTITTELLEIPGIGKKTAMKLLERFGSVEGVRYTSEPELITAIGLQATKKIIEYFKEKEALAHIEADKAAE
jgi:excinuclease ABC subunit C